MSDVRCSLTHHNACNCREAHFARVEGERDRLRAEVPRLAAVVEAAERLVRAEPPCHCGEWAPGPCCEACAADRDLRTALAALDGGGR